MTITKILKFLEKYSEDNKKPNLTLDSTGNELSFNVYRKDGWVSILVYENELKTRKDILEEIRVLLKD